MVSYPERNWYRETEQSIAAEIREKENPKKIKKWE